MGDDHIGGSYNLRQALQTLLYSRQVLYFAYNNQWTREEQLRYATLYTNIKKIDMTIFG